MRTDNGILQSRICRLKDSLGAIILAHNYQRPEVQEIADFCGDSLELARRSADLTAEMIVFCGVRFMAETAALLNPDRPVLLPEEGALCPLAAQIDPHTLQEWKDRYPGLPVVCYVNSTVEVKAHSDILCTSANAVAVVESLDSDGVLFIPDGNLGHYISTQTEVTVISYPGNCYLHDRITLREIETARHDHPAAQVLVHPECRPEVVVAADAVLSTAGMIRYAQAADADEFIIATEIGLLYQLRKRVPGKQFYTVGDGPTCRPMKLTTLDSVLRILQHRQPVISVPSEMRPGALRALQQMLVVT